MVLYLEEAIATLKVEITVRNEGAIIIQKKFISDSKEFTIAID